MRDPNRIPSIIERSRTNAIARAARDARTAATTPSAIAKRIHEADLSARNARKAVENIDQELVKARTAIPTLQRDLVAYKVREGIHASAEKVLKLEKLIEIATEVVERLTLARQNAADRADYATQQLRVVETEAPADRARAVINDAAAALADAQAAYDRAVAEHGDLAGIALEKKAGRR